MYRISIYKFTSRTKIFVLQEELDAEFEERIRINKEEAEARTAKKRAKRVKKKLNQRKKANVKTGMSCIVFLQAFGSKPRTGQESGRNTGERTRVTGNVSGFLKSEMLFCKVTVRVVSSVSHFDNLLSGYALFQLPGY